MTLSSPKLMKATPFLCEQDANPIGNNRYRDAQICTVGF